uniref:Doublecortin domain-containing protein n=1 Tax=Macrostomum lignano TaxID=282301 RepID=A0A1I8FRT1_9PLAT
MSSPRAKACQQLTGCNNKFFGSSANSAMRTSRPTRRQPHSVANGLPGTAIVFNYRRGRTVRIAEFAELPKNLLYS